jgi:osmotically-inducible protein OsmY
MRFWTLFFIVCLELLSNAARSVEPTEVLQTRIAEVSTMPVESEQYLFDKDANKASDRGLVNSIRNQLVNDTTLSKSGKNIQIIVVGKEITLKGPVPSESEENKILSLTGKNSSGHNIRNQMEVIRE